MDIKTFTAVASKLPPQIAVLMRGPTGVGKSDLARQVAEELKLPYIDVRGSTMSEGDVGGYPDIEGMKRNGIMTFCMPSWFIRACRTPVVLMLDELNRSLPGVQQSFFQLVLDRELGSNEDGVPYRLHPETRVFAAVNHGSEYDVNDMDPALLRRFWVADLKPTNEDFLDWAEGKLDRVLVDFIRQNPAHLRVDPGSVESGTVCPNPASWHRLDTSLSHMGLAPSSLCGQKSTILYSIATGFVGLEASIALSEFVTKYERVVSAEDVLNRWKEIEGNLRDESGELVASTVVNVIEKLASHSKETKWSKAQVKNAVAFAKALPGELLVTLWKDLASTSSAGPAGLANLQALHKEIGPLIVESTRAARNLEV